jgi:hypothetical protein
MDDTLSQSAATAAKMGAPGQLRGLLLLRCRILRGTPSGFGRFFLDRAFAAARDACTSGQPTGAHGHIV